MFLSHEPRMLKHKFEGSSLIKEVEFDAVTEQMDVVFNNNMAYRYHAIPKTEYQALVESASAGKYFSENIRNRYSYTKLS